LMMVALPTYNNYSTKSKFAEVVLATTPTKTAISICAESGDCVSGGAISLGASGGAAIPTLALLSSAASVVPTSANQSAAFVYAVTAAGYQDNGYSSTTATTMAQNYATSNSSGAGPYMVMHAANPPWPANTYCITGTASPGSCSILPGTTATIQSYLSAGTNPFYSAGVGASVSTLANLPCVGAASTGCSPSTKYAASVSYSASGVITGTAQTTSGLNAETFVLVPALSGGRVDWSTSGSCKTRAGGALC